MAQIQPVIQFIRSSWNQRAENTFPGLVATATKAGEANKNHFVTAVSVGIQGVAFSVIVGPSAWTLYQEPYNQADIILRGAFEHGASLVLPYPIKIGTGLGVRLEVVANATTPPSNSVQANLLGITLTTEEQDFDFPGPMR